MKILKILLFFLLIAVVTPLIIALFMPKEYSVLEKVVIDRPLDEVYDFTIYLKNQGQYSKWQLMDPEMEHYYEGEDGTVGFVSGWKSKNPDVGHGEQEIVAIHDKERIDYELRFIEPFQSSNQAYMSFVALGPNQTEVGWGFDGGMNYPMNFLIPMMNIEGMISGDFKIGLANLKDLLEN